MPPSPEAQKRIDELKQERKARNWVVTVNIVDMHDEVAHHSFHPHFTTNQAMEVMENLRREAWSKISSEPMPMRVDKTKVRIITKEERYKDY